MLPKAQKTPLRYVGGKSRATKYLFDYAPESFDEYREPFLGGGSMAIELTRRYPDMPVWVNDKFYELYCFWTVLRDAPSDLVSTLLEAKQQAGDTEGHRALFDESKAFLVDTSRADIFAVAWRFWVVNKCGFSGLIASGFSAQASQSNFSEKNIRALAAYGVHIKNWRITNLDYSELLSGNNNAFIYLDPPYAKVGKDGKSFVYGKNAGDIHKAFNHEDFCADMIHVEGNAMISYDANPLITGMYKDWRQDVFDLTYTMHSGKAYREDEKNRKELILMNYAGKSTVLEALLEGV